MVLTRYVKIPGPGQFRGEGEWVDFESTHPMSLYATKEDREESMEDDWAVLVRTGALPTKEE
jgi:hypothetical protein